ncbi:lysoplasmalogenase [Yinghuangia seranimata]|uniref:lysoplasmalogenase n=1 Tax=Yinghuangia seranimata TaxID=408067 RepID=UPI00248D008F|nr:lysoplasmalogenase [Yinghuangia seranimata]MDI2132627.1 lysoplasmalogenase [Yinghuangia seranimata]
MTGSRASRGWLAAYLVLGTLDTVLAAVDAGPVRWATKPLLMPLLAAFVVTAARRPVKELRLPLIALAGGFVGDVGLLPDKQGLFMVGMGGFAVGHVAYVRAFAKAGAGRRLVENAWIPVGYGLAWAAMIAVLWRGLDDLLVPVIGYSLLLTTMAAFAAGMDRLTALGGAAFLVSDTVIAFGIADLDVVPGQDALVMPLYLAAQLLLMTSWAPWPYGKAVAGNATAADPGRSAAV